MKKIIAILFFMLFGIFAGSQAGPEASIICGITFPIAGYVIHRLVLLPRGILGAGSFSDLFENAILDLVFDNVDFANIGDAAGLQNSAADGSIFVALYTVAPTDAGGGTECAYTGYARQAVSRTNGWTVSVSNVSNAAAITFPENTGSSETAVAMGIFTAVTGGDFLGWCDLDSNITIDNGTIPEIPIGDLDINMD